MRRRCASRSNTQLVLAVAALVATMLATSPAVASGRYSWPVEGPVVAVFDAPANLYAAGHRGTDLRVEAGASVRAMADGEVSFAGRVVDAAWVTVRHADGVRTTYGPMDVLAVTAGSQVRGGAIVGTAAGRVHDRDALHVSARIGPVYIDPAGLLVEAFRPSLVGGVGHAGPAPSFRLGLTAVAGSAPSPNHLILLSGLTSQTGQHPLDPGDLGYPADQWSAFSYVGVDVDGQPLPYTPQDTWQHVHASALALQAQLRAFAAEHPGEAVDLVGHSLGGLVAMYYTLVLHDPADPTLPPLGKVATLASPLGGADVARVLADAQDDPYLHALVELLVERVGRGSLDDDADVMGDLVPGSDVTQALSDAWQRIRLDPYGSTLAAGTDLLTIGGLLDPVVPDHRSDLDGLEHETVLADHTDTPRDERTHELLWAFLAGRPAPSGSLVDDLVNIASPLTVGTSLLELLIGGALEAFDGLLGSIG